VLKSGVFERIDLSASKNSVAVSGAPDARWLFLAGFVIGLGAGARIDVILMFPVLLLPILLQRPLPLNALLFLILGLMPGLLFLSYSNLAKFGEFIPFSYGPIARNENFSFYLPLFWIAGSGMLAVAISPIRYLKWYVLSSFVLLLIGLLLSQGIRGYFYQLLQGSFQLLVDFRIRDMGRLEPGLSRGPSGGMVYMGALKKSLLQSLPWVPLLIVPIFAIVRDYSSKMTPLLLALFLPII
jgi:hypothetical protein